MFAQLIIYYYASSKKKTYVASYSDIASSVPGKCLLIYLALVFFASMDTHPGYN